LIEISFKKIKMKKVIIILLVLVVLVGLFYFMFLWKGGILPVDTSEVEEELCEPTPGYEAMKVERCINGREVIYEKAEDVCLGSGCPTDQGQTSIYNKRGWKVCEYCWFCVNGDGCSEYFEKCDSEDWQRICGIGGW